MHRDSRYLVAALVAVGASVSGCSSDGDAAPTVEDPDILGEELVVEYVEL